MLEFSVDLPAPIEGMTYEDVEVGDGIATLMASFDRLVFRVIEPPSGYRGRCPDGAGILWISRPEGRTP